jgi:hypothetical protein
MPSGMIVQTRPTTGRYMEQLAVTTAVQVLTPAKYAPTDSMEGGAQEAFLTLDGGNIRYSYCPGVTPSATVGHLLLDGGILILRGQQQMKDFKCFQNGTAGSTITITYEFE